MRLEVHIEELVLHGFAPADRHRISDAVQHELARLLESGGAPARPAQGGRAGTIGQQVARAVYGQIARTKKGPNP